MDAPGSVTRRHGSLGRPHFGSRRRRRVHRRELAEARRQPWRYLAPAVFRYSGPDFSKLPEAVVGWMLRDDANSDRATFDIKTVANALILTGSAGTAQPFVYDLAERAVIYLDLYQRSSFQASVHTDGARAASTAALITTRRAFKPSYDDIISANLEARGGRRVEDRSEATVTIGLDDGCTYNALRPQGLINDFLSAAASGGIR